MSMKGNLSGERVEAGSADIPEGGQAPVRITKQRALHVNLRDNDGNAVSVGGGGTQYEEGALDFPVTGTVMLFRDNNGSGGLEIPSTAAPLPVDIGDLASQEGDAAGKFLPIGGINNSSGPATVGIARLGPTNADGEAADATNRSLITKGRLYVWNGTTWDRMPGDAANGADVDVTRMPGLAGDVAHDGSDSGNPVKIGAKAETALSGITLVADGDRTNLYSDADGVLYVKPLCGYGDIKQNGGQTLTGTTSTAVTNLGATASSYNYVTEISIWNYSAVDTYIKLQDGNGGTQFWVFPAPALGGCCQTFNVPLKQPSSNTALYMAEGGAANGIIVSIKGFQSKV